MKFKETSYFSDPNNYLKYFKPKPNMICVDVGAQFGGVTHWILKLNKDLTVVAIEPNPYNFIKLKKRFKNNKHVLLVEKACWLRKETMPFHILPEPSHGRLKIYDRPHPRQTEIVNVEADTLDNILAELNIDCVDYVKIDTEGFESRILKHFTKYRKGTIFHLEHHGKLLSILKQLKDLNIWIIEVEHFTYALPKYERGCIHAEAL